MRAIIMLLFLSMAGTCYAEDPLETLNTVEDTLTTMEQTLKSKGVEQGYGKSSKAPSQLGLEGEDVRPAGRLFFVSEETLGSRDWLTVTPCSEEGAASLTGREAESCGSPADNGASSSHLWKSRVAVAADLRPGVLVVARDKTKDGAWIMSKVTDASELASGYVTISAPFKPQLKDLRVVEE